MHKQRHFSLRLGAALLTFAFVAFGLIGCTVTPIAGSGTPTPSSSPGTPANTATSGSPTPNTPVSWSGGWNSFMLASQTSGSSNYVILNANLQDQHTALTQYAVPQAQFGSISPDGKDVLYSVTTNNYVQFYTALSPRPSTGFFYEVSSRSAYLTGNVIWMSDSRHALVLDPVKGVWSVDVQTGQAQQVLSLPFSSSNGTVDGIQQLLAYRDGYLYFQGGGGGYCIGAICRVQLNTTHWVVTQYSSRQTGNSDFLLSPDGGTIYYCNTGPAGQAGLYAVNSDGSHSRILRASSTGSDCGGVTPIGFAQDNGLVVMSDINGKFEVLELGTTPQQDNLILADAAPGANSLCASSNEESFSANVCSQDVALAPYSHALVVQGKLPDGTLQLWGTDLITGQQHVLKPIDNGGKPVQLLGWDQLSVCAAGRC